MTPLRLIAPAKLNLDLRVFPAEPSGYHPLHSWFRTVDLADELTFESADDFSLDVDGADLGDPRENLVTRAWRQCEAAARESLGTAVRLTKTIPHGGGLGGGSSDAAAAIVAFQRFHNERVGRPLPKGVLREIAAKVGSDVPFFLADQVAAGCRSSSGDAFHATCAGRGERVAPFRARRLTPLLILPDLRVATPSVFARFDAQPHPAPQTPRYAEWSQLDALRLLPKLANDLEPAAFALHPQLGQLRQTCEERLGRPVRMSGSGSTLFTLFDTPDEATEAAESVADLATPRVA